MSCPKIKIYQSIKQTTFSNNVTQTTHIIKDIINYLIDVFNFLILFIDFREKGEGGERQRERERGTGRETDRQTDRHQSVVSLIYAFIGGFLHVP